MALTQVSRGLLSTSIVDNGNATAITIDSSENVTFSGTVTADGLEVEAAAPILEIDSTTSSSLATLQFTSNGTVDSKITHQASTGILTIDSGRNSSWGGNIYFVTDTDTRMVIQSSGNVLVGKTSTGDYVTGIEMQPAGAILSYRTNGVASIFGRTNDGEITRFTRGGSIIGNIGVESGDNFIIEATATDHAGLLLWGSGGSGRVTPRLNGSEANGTVDLGRSSGRFKNLYLSGVADLGGVATSGDNYVYSYSGGSSGQVRSGIKLEGSTNTLEFYTGQNEAMRIDASGRLLMGRTTDFGSSGYQLQVDFSGTTTGILVASDATASKTALIMHDKNNGSAAGSITYDGLAVQYNTSSDQRLKENIADADDAGSKVDAIQVRKFDWIADGSHQDYGMVAQELQTVAPEAVSAPEDPDEMMGVDYSKLVPMLVKEIQSLRNRVAQLENN